MVTEIEIGKLPIQIIDGDRGVNYPKQIDLLNSGYCLFLSAKNITTDGFKINECKWITEEKDQILKKGKLKRWDVVLTTRGTVGNTGYFNSSIPFDHVRINSGMVILRTDKSKFNSRFLYQILKSQVFSEKVNSIVSGSAQPQLPIRDLLHISLSNPPIIEQKAIAHILGTLDDKIELNRKTNETLEEMAKALFKSWFVDFDPVHAKAEGKPTGLPAAISDLFPDTFQPSELGEIPRGWEVCDLNKAISIEYGKNLPTKDLNHDGFPVFGGNGLIGYHSKYLYECAMTLVACRGAASGKVHRSLPQSFVTNNSLVMNHIKTSFPSGEEISFSSIFMTSCEPCSLSITE